MNQMQIETTDGRLAFAPGEEIAGFVSWHFSKPPRKVELRLFWFTRGRGAEDVGVVEGQLFERPLAEERRPFSFRLPPVPYSFRGQLISLAWGLELVGPGEVARLEIIVGPHRREIQLGAVPEHLRVNQVYSVRVTQSL